MTTYQNYKEFELLNGRIEKFKNTLNVVEFVEGQIGFVCVVLGTILIMVTIEGFLHQFTSHTFTLPLLFFKLSFNIRMIMLVVLVGVVCWALIRYSLSPLVSFKNSMQAARYIERYIPNLKNGLINAIQLNTDRYISSKDMVRGAIQEIASSSQDVRFERAIQTKKLKKRAIILSVLIAVAVLYTLFGFSRFSSALVNILRPNIHNQFIGSVQFDVTPGNTSVTEGGSLAVQATISQAPEDISVGKLIYEYDNRETNSVDLVPQSASVLSAQIVDIRRPLKYYVSIRDSQSAKYSVTVLSKPIIRTIKQTYFFPQYTNLPQQVIEKSDGSINALAGTEVTLEINFNKPIRKASLLLNDKTNLPFQAINGDPMTWKGTITLEQSGYYQIDATDFDDFTLDDNTKRYITVQTDKPPVVSFVRPKTKKTRLSPGDELELIVKGSDDFGVKEMAIIRKADETTENEVMVWNDFQASRLVNKIYNWTFDTKQFTVGDTVTFYAVAYDNNPANPQHAVTDDYEIIFEDKEKTLSTDVENYTNWREALEKILRFQKEKRETATSFEKMINFDELAKNADQMSVDQTKIRNDTLAVADTVTINDVHLKRIRDALYGIANNEMLEAIKNAGEIRLSKDILNAKEPIGNLEKNQDKIIEVLTTILDILPILEERVKKQLSDEGGFDLDDDSIAKLEDVKDKLRDFIEDQKKVIDATEDLAKMPVDDFTDKEEKLLKELKAIEDDWSRILKEEFSDLSKLPNQDFANSSLVEDSVAIIAEVDMASDALTKKAVELAIPIEESGLELAEKIEANLEAWLPDKPDREAWKMEEPLTEYETPMPELLTELEDQIGELMEQEEDLFEDVEDYSSAWSDSIDKGAGWDVLDGPISNMSARGKTGNVLPNTSEIGGRAGQGRQGKSSGEMVGSTASNKGGRKTPSRVTPDPFMTGQVKDTSTEPPGGATGGGKVSGFGSEGLEGPVPGQQFDPNKLPDLVGRQASLRNKAEKIKMGFEVANYPTDEIQFTVEQMKSVEDDLNSGKYLNALRKRNILLKSMEDTQTLLQGEIVVHKDRTPNLPKELEEDISDSMRDKNAPKGYEQLLENYYKLISED